MIGKAQEKKKIKVSYYDPKEYTRDRYGRVDRRPYGGGPGMVLEPDSMLRAAEKAIGKKKNVETIFFATDGEVFSEEMAKSLATKKDIVFICGHYEGVDARVPEILKAKKVSVGPYVLTGGELPAATMVDAISRFVPGVLGKNKELIKELNVAQIRALIADGTISGGMIPKVETCIYALEQGVEGVVILDGKVPHAVLLELFTDHGAGTLIHR